MAIEISTGVGTESNPVAAAASAAKQAMHGHSEAPVDLALVFSSIEYARNDVLEIIAEATGALRIVGASSLAIITDTGIHNRAISVSLLSLPKNVYLHAACVKDLHPASIATSSSELAGDLLHGFVNYRRDFATMFSDGLMRDGTHLLSGLQMRLGTSFPIVGGSASDDLNFKKTYIYYNKEALNYAACGILWGGKINFGIGSRHGWKAIGKPRKVTRSKGNVVFEIDNKPAVNIYKEYFGCDLQRLRKELKRISILYPIGIYLSKEEEYLLRNIFTIDNENGSIVFAGSVPEESMIKLMIGTQDSCLDAARQAVSEARNTLVGKNADLAIIFDSASRHTLLGRKSIKELEIIKNGLNSECRIIGLYTYGEQAPLKAFGYHGQSYFHNQTITVLTMGG